MSTVQLRQQQEVRAITSEQIEMAFVGLTALMWADILAGYALWMMMTYLTNVWKLNFTHAAAIINIWWGLASLLQTCFAFIVDTFMGNYWMILLSSFAYCTGLGFLSMSTPPVLSNATCSAYQPECIGDRQRILFYIALALLAVGICGRVVSLVCFIVEQFSLDLIDDVMDMALDMDMNTHVRIRRNTQIRWEFGRSFAEVLFAIIGGLALANIKPWSVRFGIPAICTVVATLLFLSLSCSYKCETPKGSPLTNVFRVFVASALKIFHQLPKDVEHLYEQRCGVLRLLPHTSGFRCLDKAAIILPTQTLDQQENNRWRLCTVTEVEETKMGIRTIPMWMTFIICGVVSSTGNTYFLEQANHMNRMVGRLNVPLPILLILYILAKSQFTTLFFKVANVLCGRSRSRQWYAPRIGIALAMIMSILCCITAAKVEARRLDVIKSHGLVDKPNERIPMSIFWLLPQFLLLGAHDGISKSSTGCVFSDKVSLSMTRYLYYISNGVFGTGIFGSVLLVCIVGKVSARGGRPSWFQDTLNKSRLDNYYWTLAVLCTINLVLYILVAIWYAYGESASKDEEQRSQSNESEQPYNVRWGCSVICYVFPVCKWESTIIASSY